MKIIVEYNPNTGNIVDNNGVNWMVGIGVPFTEFKEEDMVVNNIVTGLTVEDLVKLKTNGVI